MVEGWVVKETLLPDEFDGAAVVSGIDVFVGLVVGARVEVLFKGVVVDTVVAAVGIEAVEELIVVLGARVEARVGFITV